MVKSLKVISIFTTGELKPCESKTVQLELTCYEVGILDEIFIPCFIGEYQEPLQMRLLCVVDCLHVFFYLPTKNNDFQKVLWPPKVIYEYDSNWSHYCSCEEVLKVTDIKHLLTLMDFRENWKSYCKGKSLITSLN